MFSIGPAKQQKQHLSAIIFLSINWNMCFVSSKEPSQWDGSFEHPQHMFWLRNKKIIISYTLLPGGLELLNIFGFLKWRFFFVCFVALRPKSTAMVMAGRSVHTLFPGQAWTSSKPELRAHTFACNWQQPFLNDSAEGRRMTVEIISWSISMKVWDRTGDRNLDSQSDSHLLPDTLPTALCGPVLM